MSVVVVDTNVVLVANGQHSEVSPECVKNCALTLLNVMKSGTLALDDGFRILREYLQKTQPKKGNRPGDAFVKWALNNQRTAKRVDRVSLVAHHARGFESFPDDSELAKFVKFYTADRRGMFPAQHIAADGHHNSQCLPRRWDRRALPSAGKR